MAYFPTSGSVYGSDGAIPDSAGNMTQLYLVANEGVAASANIQHGAVTASTIALLRAPEAGMSQVITFISSTCLSVSDLEDGDVIALIRK